MTPSQIIVGNRYTYAQGIFCYRCTVVAVVPLYGNVMTCEIVLEKDTLQDWRGERHWFVDSDFLTAIVEEVAASNASYNLPISVS